MNQPLDRDPATMLLDVIVVGAGQAGLATGHFLRQTGLSFRLFDRAGRIGDSWRHRYDSLVLFSARTYSSLPGLPMDGDPEGYPGKDEMADYLERYAQACGLPRSLGEGITSAEAGRRVAHQRCSAELAMMRRGWSIVWARRSIIRSPYPVHERWACGRANRIRSQS